MLDRRSVGLHVMPIASATLSDGRNRENAPQPSAIYVLVTELGAVTARQNEYPVTRRQSGAPARARWPAGRFTAHAEMRCDTRSHVSSEYVDWRFGNAEDVTPGQCSRSVPALACAAGNGWVRSPGESPRAAVPSSGHR